MALPRIAPYSLPSAADLPDPRVGWRVEVSRAALLIHDAQRYFIDAFPGDRDPIVSMLANITRLRDACRARGIPVFYTAQPGGQQRSERGLQADFWGPGMSADPNHRDIVPSLAPAPDEVVLPKHRYSAFQRTNFEAALGASARDQLIITGVYAHIGCLLTAAEAFMRDVEPFFVADAVADFSRADHDLAVAHVAGCCGVAVTTTHLLDVLS